MEFKEKLEQYIEDNFKNICELRGYLHDNPELSENEFKTVKKIKEELHGLDIEYVNVEGNSIVGIIDTGKEGKTLLLRADMDALEIEEYTENFKNKKSYISKVEGISHMCGHDAHTTILLESIKFLYSQKNNLKGKIVFIFEEGEENGKGIRKVLDTLKTLGINACFGMHVVNFLDSGKVSLDPGPRMAGVSRVDIDIIGHGGHGSRPDLAINPLFCGADILNTLTSLWPNKFGPNEICTLGITNLIGGTAHNIIEEKMRLVGTIRYFSKDVGEKGINLISDTAIKIGDLHKCKIRINHSRKASPALINDDNLSDFTKNNLKESLEDALVECEPWFGSETFTLYRQIAPSLFGFLGNRNENKGIIAENHDPRFDIDDDLTLPTGIKTMVLFAYNYLNEY